MRRFRWFLLFLVSDDTSWLRLRTIKLLQMQLLILLQLLLVLKKELLDLLVALVLL